MRVVLVKKSTYKKKSVKLKMEANSNFIEFASMLTALVIDAVFILVFHFFFLINHKCYNDK
ncbi:hypothetical protein LSPH26S_02909 [Lysinibacillus sphaericus]